MAKKNTPELIDLPENALEEIKARITTCTLLEEDKKIILVIITSYAWIMRQLKFTKISMARLKNLFGFNTEKRKNNKKKHNSNTNAEDTPELEASQETQPLSLNELQGIEQELPGKK
jgi:hypothetical protein